MGSLGPRDIEVEAHLGRTIDSEFYYYAKNEVAFIASEEFTNASIGDTVALSMMNPAGSGTTAMFALIRVSTASRSYARVYDTFDSGPTGGTAADVENVLLDTGNGAADTGEVTVEKNPTYTSASTHVAEPLGGGTGGNAIASAEAMPVLALEPDRDVVIEVEKLADGPDQVSITVRWFEIPAVLTDQNTDPKFEEAIRG